MAKASHRTTDNGDTVTIHDLEVFSAYDPEVDSADPDLKAYDNRRLKKIVHSTNKYIDRGSLPQLVIMHERDGNEPKSCVGRFPTIKYKEVNGIGQIVGDCVVEKPIFDKFLATNAFPRRSAEIWQEQNHLSEVALLGRETPRRALPDSTFKRPGSPQRFARSIRFDMGAVGGGGSTFIPSTSKGKNMAKGKDRNSAADLNEERFAKLEAGMEEIRSTLARIGGEDDKLEGEADDMLVDQHGLEDEIADDIAEDIADGDDDSPFEDQDAPRGFSRAEIVRRAQREFAAAEARRLTASGSARRGGGKDTFALRLENSRLKAQHDRMAREIRVVKAEMKRDRFDREIDVLVNEGYRISDEQRPKLMSQLQRSDDPVALIESWRDLFSRDPIGTGPINGMQHATTPGNGKVLSPAETAELVKQFAGKPMAEYTKEVNRRMGIKDK